MPIRIDPRERALSLMSPGCGSPPTIGANKAPEGAPGGSRGTTTLSRRDLLVWAAISAGALLLGGGAARAQKARLTKVGFVIPETGPLAGEARSLYAGFQLFLQERRNELPSLEILKKDPGPKEENALEVLTGLVMNEEVQFLVGPLSLKAATKAVHAVAEAKTILFVTNSSVRLVGGEMCLPQAFRVGGNTYQAAQPLAPWAVKHVGSKVFLTGEDDWLGNEQADFFAAGFERSGGMFVDRIMVGEGSPDIKELLTEIRKSKADFVFASFRDRRAAAFLKAFRNASPGLNHPIIGPESVVGFPPGQSSESKNCAGVRTLATMKDPQSLMTRIKQKLNREITHPARAAEGYDIADMICNAVRQTSEEKTDLASLIAALENVAIEGPRGKVTFDKNHEPLLNVMVREWVAKGRSVDPTIVADLGPVSSPDFGCGRVGFPRRPDQESKDEEEQGGDEVEWEK